MANTDIIIHDEKDNVGVVVIDKITPIKNVIAGLWKMINLLKFNLKMKSR